jgi:membrane protease YdiL (CAAX protease family)
MGPHITTEILRAVVLGMILTILFGAIASWIWTIGRLLRGESLLPDTPLVERRKPPWGLGTILLILVAYIVVSHQAFVRFATADRAEPPGEAVEAPAPAATGKHGPVKAQAKNEGEAAHEPERNPPHEPAGQTPAPPNGKEADSLPNGVSPLELMTIQGAVNGVFILLLPLLARLTSGARLRDLGLSLRDWQRQAAVGIVAVLFLMPIVYSVQMACVFLLQLPDQEREKFKHPLEKMLRDNFSPGVASLAFLSAVVLAPVFEELLFRGFIQSWLVKALEHLADQLRSMQRRLRRPQVDELERSAGQSSASESNPPLASPSIDEESPADFLNTATWADPDLEPTPIDQDSEIGYWETVDDASPPDNPGDRSLTEPPRTTDLTYRPRSSYCTAIAISLTSVLFAVLHAAQWPAPIPLFLLALGLGVVYQRTGSLLAPIAMHAVFNAFSTLMLFMVALPGGERGKPADRPALERVVPLEKSEPVVPVVDPGPQRGKT